MNPKNQLIAALKTAARINPGLILAAANVKTGRMAGMADATQTATAIVENASTNPGMLDSLAANLDKILASIVSYRQSEKILDVNLQRAKQGLPPINAESVAPTVNFGVSSSVTNLILMGVGILALVYLVKK